MDKLKKAILVVVLVFGLVLGFNASAVHADDFDDTPDVPVVTGP